MSGIRVTYSGAVAFAVASLGVVFGLAFTLMLTRSLTPEEFGAYSLLISMVGYFMISETIVSYWAVRQVARGEDVGKTAILSSVSISGASIPLFVAYVALVSQNNTVPSDVLMAGAALLLVQFICKALTGINLAHRPQSVSYGTLLFSVLRVAVGALTVLVLQWDILGAILAMLAAYAGNAALQTCAAMPKMRERARLSVLVGWMKTSWLPLFAAVPRYLHTLDVVLYSVITGSVIGVAYYHAAFAIARLTMHPKMLTEALYPKLVADGALGGVSKNLVLVIYVAIPMTVLSVVFAEAGLFILNPVYQGAWLAVVLLAVRGFFHAVRRVPVIVLSGMERADADGNVTLSRLAASNLFKTPLVSTVVNVMYIVLLVACLALLDADEVWLVTAWAAMGLLAEIAATAIMWRRASRITQLPMPWISTLKFMLAAALLAAVFYATSPHVLDYSLAIYEFVPLAMGLAAVCMMVYLGVTYAIDRDTRSLFGAAYHAMTKR